MLLSLNNIFTNEKLLDFEIVREVVSETEQEVRFAMNFSNEDFAKRHAVVLRNDQTNEEVLAFSFDGILEEKFKTIKPNQDSQAIDKQFADLEIYRFPVIVKLKHEVAAMMVADFIEIVERAGFIYSQKDMPNG